MSRPTVDNFPVLGFVPCPGDTEIVQHTVSSLRKTAHALDEIDNVLRGSAEGEWRGKAATAFRAMLDDDLQPKIHDAYLSFDLAKRTLDNWVEYMRAKQKVAEGLETKAAEAEKSSKGKDKGKGADDSSSGDGDDDAVEQFREQARKLQEEFEERGREAASQLQKAINAAPNEPGFWESLGDSIGAFFDGIGDAIADGADWLADQLGKIAPLLKFIGDVAGLLGGIIGLLALVPGLQWLAPAALVLSFVALGAHYLSAVGKSGSFLTALKSKDVWMDVAGLGVGKVGSMIGAKVFKEAAANGGLRTVTQHLKGGTVEMPQGLFQLGRDAGYTMTNADMGWRGAQLFSTWTGHVLTAEGTDGIKETVGKIATLDPGPMTEKPGATVTSPNED